MTDVAFVPATEGHIKECAENMRKQDRAEVMAAYGHSPLEALERAMKHGAIAALADGKVVAVYGISSRSPITRVGSPWMLTTNEVEKHRKLFLKHTKQQVNQWRREYTVMFNYVDARYTQAIRWLKWLGFTVYPAEPFGPYGAPFHRFHMVTEDV